MKRSQKPPVMQVKNTPEIRNNEPGAMESGANELANKVKKRKKQENDNKRNMDVSQKENENNSSANSLYNYIINGFAFNKTAY